jgi:hypothetical protein
MENKTFKFLDARAVNKENPETFHVPSTFELKAIEIGDNVKVCIWDEHNQPERLWVEITAINRIDGGSFQGELNNVPLGLEPLKYRDTLVFGPENILDIMKSF